MEAYQLCVGTKVRIWNENSENPFAPEDAQVTEIDIKDGLVYVTFDLDSIPWAFRPTDIVRWPRRRSGEQKLWMEESFPALDVKVGDVIPTFWGWQDLETVGLSEGFKVQQVNWYPHIGEWHFQLTNLSGTYRLIVEGLEGHVHSLKSLLLPYHKKAAVDFRGEPKIHKSIRSGVYRNQAGEEKVFRLPGRGRPSLDMLPAPETAGNPTSWDDWELLQGAPHPDDPRYS